MNTNNTSEGVLTMGRNLNDAINNQIQKEKNMTPEQRQKLNMIRLASMDRRNEEQDRAKADGKFYRPPIDEMAIKTKTKDDEEKGGIAIEVMMTMIEAEELSKQQYQDTYGRLTDNEKERLKAEEGRLFAEKQKEGRISREDEVIIPIAAINNVLGDTKVQTAKEILDEWSKK